MTGVATWSLVVCGCGTAGQAGVRALLGDAALPAPQAVTLCDHATIQPHNAVSCPEYGGCAGQPKARRLAALSAQWRADAPPASAVVGVIEDLDWPALLAARDGPAAGHLAVVLMGLDDWQARLIVVEDLRRAAAGGWGGVLDAPAHADGRGRGFADSAPGTQSQDQAVMVVQVGLERNQAQVSVFGCCWSDPCPACGLAELPATEPCVVFGLGGQLLRGDLRREATAAAELVCQIVRDTLSRWPEPGAWPDTKTNLIAGCGAETFQCLTRRRAMQAGCLGPHSAGTPLRWDVPVMEGESSCP